MDEQRFAEMRQKIKGIQVTIDDIMKIRQVTMIVFNPIDVELNSSSLVEP